MFLSQSSHLFSESTALLQDRKFDTALRRSTITSFIGRKNKQHHWSDDLIWKHHPTAEEYLQDTCLLPMFLFNILSDTANTYRGRLNSWQDMWRIIETNMQIQHTWMSKSIGSPLNKCNSDLMHLLSSFGLNHCISRLISVLDDLNEVINVLPKINDYVKGNLKNEELLEIKAKLNQFESKNLGMKFTWSNKIIIIEWANRKWLLPKPYLLQIHNKLADVISILLYSLGSSGVHHPVTFYHTVLDFIKLLCSFHIKHPIMFFDFAKALEGLCVGNLIRKSEDWVNERLWNTLLEEMNELFVEDLRQHPLVHIIHEAPVDVVAELSCLSKVTGHPFVEMKEGAEKLHKRVNEPFTVSVEAVSFCISTFKENFTRNYILKYNKWPNVQFDMKHTHPALIYAYPRGLDPYSKEVINKHGKITWEEWALVELLPEMRFNFCENIIPLLKDKALSILRSEVFNSYIKKNSGMEEPDVKKRRTKFQDTRVLLHYLFTSELDTDHKEYILNFCNSSEDLHELLDYLVIRLVPKEKELKMLPRFFGCKTFKDRARTIVGEQNIATYLNLFCDEQGMTLSELALIKKLYAMQNLSKLYKTHKVFKISLDAEAWNTKQRNETNKPFACQTLDRLFNTTLYSKTHDAYERSLIYIPDEEDTHWWDGQGGGIEGLNQNQWVLLYTAEMRYSFKDTAYPFFQLIHGDDYRAAVAVPYSSIPPGEEDNIVHELMEKVSDAAKSFGHKIKLTESYASEHILCYSKIIFFKGIQLPSALRKIQKTYGSTNAFLPILDDYVGSSFSNAHSACYTTVNHYVPYIVALFWTSYYLKNCPYYSKCTQNELVALSLTPSVIGGLPIIYLHNMFVRGESDLLSSFIDLCMYTKISYPEVSNIMSAFLKIPFSQNKPYSLLLKDPYSLPIKKPTSISLYLKNIVRKRLLKTVRNNNVRDLLQGYDQHSLATWISDLITGNEWQGKPFTALYSNSPYHLLDELMSGFVSAKSIRDLLIASSRNAAQSQRILKRAIDKDVKFHKWRISVMRKETPLTNFNLPHHGCPAQIANDLRCHAWDLNITTVTHPPPQHQIKFSSQEMSYHDNWALDNHFVMTLHHPTFHISGDRWHYADGGKTPFVGHTTAAGVITPTIRVSEKDPVASKVSNLLTLRSWMNKSEITPDGVQTSEFPEFIDAMLKSYTKIPAHELQKFAPAWKSGSITHRLRAHGFRDTIVPNNLMNLYTLVTGETNTHRHFRETRDDFTVNYLHIFCYSTVIMLLDLEFNMCHEGPYSAWIITTDCEYCNLPILEPPLYFEKKASIHMFHPQIQMTHLGEAATEMIKLAQQEYDVQYPTLDIYGEEEIPIEIARAIVVYECLKKAWDERVTLSKRYGLYDMTGQGLGLLAGLTSLKTEKTLGETELRALPFSEVIDILSTYILHFYLKETPKPHRVDINARFNTIIASHLPWFTLIEWYYKAGLLRQLIRYVLTLSDMPPHEGCYYNVNTATIYIGKVLTEYAIHNPPSFAFIPGAVRDTNEILYKRYLSFYTRIVFSHHLENHKNCREQLKGLNFDSLDYDTKDHIIRSYILYSREPLSLERFLETAITERGQVYIEIQDSQHYTVEEFMKWDNEFLTPILRHFFYHHRHKVLDCLSECDWDMIGMTAEEETTVIEERYVMTRYPIGACIDIVRTNGYYEDKMLGNRDFDTDIPDDDIDILEIPDRDNVYLTFPQLDIIYKGNTRVEENFSKVHHPMSNLPWSCMTRVVGSSISSCNKFHMIFQYLDLFRYRDLKGWVVCCAEGEGGVLHYILSNFPMTYGIFNTLIDDLRSGASAGICDKDPLTSGRYYSEPLSQGVSDLLRLSTIETYINRYPHKAFIFTCDADMRNMDQRQVLNLWNNVVTWWLTVRTRNGVLILKVFSDYTEAICKIVSRLSYYSMIVKIHRVPCSHLNTEFYLTAQGTTRDLRFNDPSMVGVHPDIYANCLNFIEPIYRIYRYRKTEYDINYYMECRKTLNALVTSYNIENPLLLYIITQKLRLPLKDIYKSPHVSSLDIIEWLRLSIESELKDIEKRLRRHEAELRRSFIAGETLRHRLQLIERFAFLTVSAFVLTAQNFEAIFAELDIDLHPVRALNECIQVILQLGGVRVDQQNPRNLMLGAYPLDMESVLYKAFGSSLQIIGCLIARREIMGTRDLPGDLFDDDIDNEMLDMAIRGQEY